MPAPITPAQSQPAQSQPAQSQPDRSPPGPPEPDAPNRRLLPVRWINLALLVVLGCSLACGLAFGSVAVPLSTTLRMVGAGVTGGTITPEQLGDYQIVWQLRLPRVLLAAVVGAGLTVAGVAIQALVRNALADPFVLGISSGASVGATAVITLGLFAAVGAAALSVAAFLGALGATITVYVVARSGGGLSPLRLVLTGLALGYGFSAITSMLIFASPRGEATRSALYWLLGSLSGTTWASLPITAAVVLLGIGYLLYCAPQLNALAMGEEAAGTLGVEVAALRRTLFVLTAAVTGVVVAVSGAVGFVGLMMPHLVRMVVGADHRRVMAVAPLAGACFLVWVDVGSRTVVAPEELPLGVLTAVMGVPFFLVLIRGRGYSFGSR